MDEFDEIPRNPMGVCIVTMLLGLVGVIILFAVPEQSLIALIAGAAGLGIGGYAINIANHFPIEGEKLKFVLMAGVGLLLSVIAFILGLSEISSIFGTVG